ncbi:hypothetical protein [Jiella mangrovi]|uniref:PepSY domain-containing protein n=1 Tax=Jiella mangrovi TaxID=2821407 RepID=A0ABS4BF17_9HYPH|nr:hypothetical protein [Jiella mangrovi]MBP0615340.1 hypothetical protein [Jiella mangrovi]
MKKFILATTVFAFAAAPALAQSDTSGSTTTQQPAMSGDSGSTDQSTSTSGTKAMSAGDMVTSQNKVLKALQSAGYTDAAIMDAAYIVGATTPDGERVVMMIDTSGRVMGAQRRDGQGGQSGSNMSSGGSSNSSMPADTSSDSTDTAK